jgi:hypothetical protein
MKRGRAWNTVLDRVERKEALGARLNFVQRVSNPFGDEAEDALNSLQNAKLLADREPLQVYPVQSATITTLKTYMTTTLEQKKSGSHKTMNIYLHGSNFLNIYHYFCQKKTFTTICLMHHLV